MKKKFCYIYIMIMNREHVSICIHQFLIDSESWSPVVKTYMKISGIWRLSWKGTWKLWRQRIELLWAQYWNMAPAVANPRIFRLNLYCCRRAPPSASFSARFISSYTVYWEKGYFDFVEDRSCQARVVRCMEKLFHRKISGFTSCRVHMFWPFYLSRK